MATDGLAVETVFVNDGDGLGHALADGLRRSRAPWVCVTGGDRQPASSLIPDALSYAQESDTDLVFARQRPQPEHDAVQGRSRRARSLAVSVAAKILFPGSRWGGDEVGELLVAKREALAFYTGHDRGLKSLLAILTGRLRVRVADISSDLGSHAVSRRVVTPAEAYTYLLLLWYYRFGDDARCLLLFLAVGASSLLVNSLVMALGTDVMGIHYMAAAVLAAQIATLWSFQLVEVWVFPARRLRRGRAQRLIGFLAMSNVALVLRGPVLYTLTSELGVHYLLSNAASILAFTVVRYSVSSLWIWAK